MSPVPASATKSAAKAMTLTVARWAWDELPEQVRAAVETPTGEVHTVETITVGLNAAITARLHNSQRPGVLQGCAQRPRRCPTSRGRHQPARRADRAPTALARRHRRLLRPRIREPRRAPRRPVPELDGPTRDRRHPRSTGRASTASDGLQAHRGPLGRCRAAAGIDVGLLVGEHLLHTDLNPHNILVTEHSVRIVDWSWPTLGAAWIDPACAALWLIAEGHTPRTAETWAARIPSWSRFSPQALDAFTAINAAL
jgi:hypothetical protein